MTDEKLSEVIMKNLYAEATSLPRPEVRKNTLERLKMACDAIIDGSAKDVIAQSDNPLIRKKAPPSRELKCNSSTIDTYVRAMGWSGPVRTSCEKPDLKEYIKAREEERGAVHVSRPKSKNAELDIVLEQINAIEARNYVRKLYEIRKQTEAKYQSLISGLKHVPALDVNALLNGEIAKNVTLLEAPKSVGGLTPDDIDAVKNIVSKLTDNDKLSRDFDLLFDGQSLKQKTTGKRLLNKKDLETLNRLAKV